jgi:organic hydroperoxide reductase OsmC/OhrA
MSTATGARHEYTARIIWTGNLGEGTSAYTAYGREYLVAVPGKPELAGSADPSFRGAADRHNPEDLFLAALSACHMLFYLSLCARKGVRVLAYEDAAEGIMVVNPGGGGRFEEVTLRPTVVIAHDGDIETAKQLHHNAHELCFIANSCNVPIKIEPVIGLG